DGDVKKALALIAKADVLVEGFRPGVTERLGLGPDVCHAENPALVYARMTGWGQNGPLSKAAGHDINYIALAGALDAIGTKSSGPVPPLNLVGDFGGGGMLVAYGICAALLPAKISGKGSVIDAAMLDGAALLMAMPFGLKAQGLWPSGRGNNLLDGGAPFYGTYKTSDEKWVAVGAIEEPFWQALIQALELDAEVLKHRMDRTYWPQITALIGEKIASETLGHWEARFEDFDACFAPVLSMDQVADHPHSAERRVFQLVDGVTQPAPAPRFNGMVPDVAPTDVTAVGYQSVLSGWS
ncbi:unnamed protein product, partial [Cyprideis torosa]